VGKVPGRQAWRRWVLARGIDDTAAATGRATLVVAPHPDDETIGAGAAIARKAAAGTPVHVVVVTDGRHSHRSPLISPARLAEQRAGESRQACALLGVAPDALRFLGFEEETLWRCLDDVAAALAAVIAEVRPAEILVTSEHDWHTDHQAVNAAVRRATALTGFTGRLGAFPVWFWADGPWRTLPTAGLAEQLRTLAPHPLDGLRLPRPWLVATGEFAATKRQAFGCYTSQVTNLTGEATWATFPTGWIEPFCGSHEPFFPLLPDAAAASDRITAAAARPGTTGAGRTVVTAVDDRFEEGERAAGTVVGSAVGATYRDGVDAEGRISIDGSEVRFAALTQPGWGRQGLAYGPFARTPGLTLVVAMLNGHNTAQSNILPRGRKDTLARLAREFPRVDLAPAHLLDNLAVGFFPEPAPADPTTAGNALVMSAGGVINGVLEARVGGGRTEVVRAVQEVPLHYVVIVRERGALYALGSLPGAHGAAALPSVRPLAVDRNEDAALLWAGVHQAVHGEVGHDMASRIAAVRAEVVPGLAGFGAGALLADRLTTPEPGSPWQPGEGTVVGGADGASGGGWIWAELGRPAGLVTGVVCTAAVQGEATAAGLLFRLGPGGSGGWRLVVGRDLARVECRAGHGWDEVATARVRLASATCTGLQILDEGGRFTVTLGDRNLFGWVEDARHRGGTGVGVLTPPAGSATITDVEVFPSEIDLPLDVAAPWWAEGGAVVWEDTFPGPAGPLELEAGSPAGRTGPVAAGAAGPGWQRWSGAGRFARLGDERGGGAAVVASAAHPNPGRTLYTTPWLDPGFADLEVVLTPPGTAQGQGEGGRGGLTFVEDADNLLVLNCWLDDTVDHDGSSLSLFFRLGGEERLYDAVWTNVGRRIRWGHTITVRACFDGTHLLAWLDGEPVLWRRLHDVRPAQRPLRINHVGLAANWEWGDDTGTTFHRLTARRR
jgi:LmbE family N-acetylglucosaminyl deacetylase